MDEFISAGPPLTADGLDKALSTLGAEAEALWAVLATETSGCGYLADRRPKILFERHYFHRLTGGKFDSVDPDVSAPTAGGYGPSGAHQYDRLAAAIHLDRTAALRSASWGLGQIMGDNFAAAGFKDVETMVAAFVASEDRQLAGMAAFIAGGPLKAALRTRDWKTFARLYNGPNYAANNYDGHLDSAYSRFKQGGSPDIRIRAAQIHLYYRGQNTGGIDGLKGRHTTDALAAFQKAKGITPADGQLTDATLAALAA